MFSIRSLVNLTIFRFGLKDRRPCIWGAFDIVLSIRITFLGGIVLEQSKVCAANILAKDAVCCVSVSLSHTSLSQPQTLSVHTLSP